MLPMQRPLSYLTDRYSIWQEGLDNDKEILYKKTARIEKLTAFTRFWLAFIVLGLPVTIIGGLLFLGTLVLSFFSEFLSTLAWLLLAAVVIGWFVGAGYFAYANMRNSEAKKLDDDSGSREVAWALGAREYSSSEATKLTNVLKAINKKYEGTLLVHRDWWVIDSEVAHAVTLGPHLYITSGAINSPHLTAIMSHELGHIANNDGFTLSSLRAFVSPYLLYRLTNFAGLTKGVLVKQDTVTDIREFHQSVDHTFTFFLYSLLFGGLGVMYYSSDWAEWFRNRDYLADDFVINLGLGQQLKSYLESTSRYAVGMPYTSNWTAFTELRLDRIALWDKLYEEPS